MDIPKLQDVKSQLVAKEVDDLLTVDKELSHKMQKLSTTYLLFTNEDQDTKL